MEATGHFEGNREATPWQCKDQRSDQIAYLEVLQQSVGQALPCFAAITEPHHSSIPTIGSWVHTVGLEPIGGPGRLVRM